MGKHPANVNGGQGVGSSTRLPRKWTIKQVCPRCNHGKAWANLNDDFYTCTRCGTRFKGMAS